jgi:hypothetical protein
MKKYLPYLLRAALPPYNPPKYCKSDPIKHPSVPVKITIMKCNFPSQTTYPENGIINVPGIGKPKPSSIIPKKIPQ